MAISASDIRSALSLPQSTPAPRRAAKKPDGISRELYSLIGPSAPSLAAHLAKPRLKQKPNLGGGGTVKWYATPFIHSPPQTVTPRREHRTFTNSARSDALQLSHWVKLSDPVVGTSYPSSHIHPRPSFFQSIPLQSTTFPQSRSTTPKTSTRISWTVRPLHPPPPLTVSYPFTDNEWTKEETDYLFSLVHEYDLRWYVIHDRYDYPHGPVRAIEVTCVDAPSIHPLTSRVRTSKTAITAHAASSSEIVHGPATSRQSPSCSTVTSSTRVSPPSPVDLHPSATHTSPM